MQTDSDGNLKVFSVERDDNGLWLNSNYDNPDNVWNGSNRWVFVRGNSLHFSPVFAGEFCFPSWPFQPPSILPISSIFIEKEIYFLLSSDFVSQSIIKNSLSVSTFLIARRTYGCFSSRARKLAVAIASIISTKNASTLRPRECLCVFGMV